jgi:hypothetical protein
MHADKHLTRKAHRGYLQGAVPPACRPCCVLLCRCAAGPGGPWWWGGGPGSQAGMASSPAAVTPQQQQQQQQQQQRNGHLDTPLLLDWKVSYTPLPGYGTGVCKTYHSVFSILVQLCCLHSARTSTSSGTM